MPSPAIEIPLTLPYTAPSTLALVSVEVVSYSVTPSVLPTVPIFTDKGCAVRPEAVDHGTLIEIVPEAGLADPPVGTTLANEPSELKVIVPLAIGLLPVMLELSPL